MNGNGGMALRDVITRALLKGAEPRREGAARSGESGPNARAVSAVEAFLASDGSSRHALLIDGPWGVGKTHFHNDLRARFGGGQVWLYVSLYGVSSKADIDNAVFAAAYPLLSGSGAAVAGAISGALLKHLKVDTKLSPKDFLTLDTVGVIVFDDLERTHLPPTELLGYLNRYVEHGPNALKVLLIANLDEMAEKAEFTRTREKVVGRSLKLVPDFGAAFPYFVTRLASPSREVVEAAAEQIHTLFRQSGLGNLRLLDQALQDLGRLVTAMDDRHRQKTELVKALTDLVVIFALELRSGGADFSDLQGRQTAWIHGMVGGEPSAVRRLSEKYPGATLIEEPVSDAVLKALFVDGVVEAELARDDLDRSRWFVTASEPAWRLAWRAHELSDELVEPAIDEMNRLWDGQAYSAVGELLHVFGIRLWQSDIGRLALDRKAVLADGLASIDSLFDKDLLEVTASDPYDRWSSHGGLGYMEIKSDEFIAFAAHLRTRRQETFLRRLPAQAAELLEELRRDPELFSRRILQNGGADSRWSRIPVLHHTDPDALASWIGEQHPALQRDVLISLSVRYEHGALNGMLGPERPWLENLSQSLKVIAGHRSPVARDRLQRNIHWYLAPVLDGPEDGVAEVA